MSVSAVNGSSSLWNTQAPPQPQQPQMTDTAKLFGISTSQLDQDLQSGSTLSSLASQDGVSSSSLISAIESDIQSNAPQGAQAPSGDQLSQMATNIANGTPPAGHHGGHHHHGMGMDMTDTSQLLGLSTTQPGQDQGGATQPGQDQGGASQATSGQSLASVLAAGAYANSASELASSATASNQISEYI
jgi:hypothetical protein